MRLICDISGLNEMQRKLIKAADPAKITRAVAQNTSEMQERAQDLCPVDTGTLKRSIGLEMRDGGKTGAVFATAHYSEYVELGTRFMKAQPYMEPAFNAQKERFLSDLKKAVISDL
ncbi:HK97-gp10 family putative phage morphogenesis protein [Dubosiella newyorkensis]|uniref:HK97-gp10 family putative phage morphogenesis protein n=1 Tax=Dubosiella newyorkensis TaxID=1862672 RepID=UPI002573217E|nr:HK97-gp10 family putative phage morphogenesis protein [Dubosiella newyorkensis]